MAHRVRDVWLSGGFGGWNNDQLTAQYDKFADYVAKSSISVSSMLIYKIEDDGSFGFHETGDPTWSSRQFQKDLQTNLGLKAMPTLFCDETIGECAPLAPKLEMIYKNQSAWIQSTIDEALQWGWDGYTIDIESFTRLDSNMLSNFLVEWGRSLENNDLEMSIWIGGPSQYNYTTLNDSPDIKSLVTMNTYTSSYQSFVYAADSTLQYVSPSKAGFGVYNIYALIKMFEAMEKTPEQLQKKFPQAYEMNVFNSTDFTLKDPSTMAISEEDMLRISEYVLEKGAYAISTWASDIPDSWIKGYQNTLCPSGDLSRCSDYCPLDPDVLEQCVIDCAKYC